MADTTPAISFLLIFLSKLRQHGHFSRFEIVPVPEE